MQRESQRISPPLPGFHVIHKNVQTLRYNTFFMAVVRLVSRRTLFVVLHISHQNAFKKFSSIILIHNENISQIMLILGSTFTSFFAKNGGRISI